MTAPKPNSPTCPEGEAVRCLKTGNPVGTDTWAAGRPCDCANCRAAVASPARSAAPLIHGQNCGVWQDEKCNCYVTVEEAEAYAAAVSAEKDAEIERLNVNAQQMIETMNRSTETLGRQAKMMDNLSARVKELEAERDEYKRLWLETKARAALEPTPQSGQKGKP